MYEWVITSLFEKDPSLMYTFTNDDELSTKFFKDTNTNDWLFKIGDWLRLKVHTSTESKLYTLRRVFKKYTINTDDLNIYIS
jgi:hypothetical protein